MRQAFGDIDAIQRRPNTAPAARHTPRIVATAAGDQHLVGEHRGPVHRPPQRIVRQLKPAQRIVGQRVGAALNDDDLRLQSPTDGYDHPVNDQIQFAVVEIARHCDVARATAGAIVEWAGERPTAIFVDRESENACIVMERVLHAIAVMGVEIDVINAAQSMIEQPQHRQRQIVEVAKPAGRDGLEDGEEVNTHETDPLDSDSDDDGLSDGDEVFTYFTNPADPDTDGDLIDDGTEVAIGTDPLVADVIGDVIELILCNLADNIIGGLDPTTDNFDAPNDKAAKGRRTALSNKVRAAKKRLADGNLTAARNKLTGDVTDKANAWLFDPAKSTVLVEIDTIVALIDAAP